MRLIRLVAVMTVLIGLTAVGSGVTAAVAGDYFDHAQQNVTAMDEAGLPTEEAEVLLGQARTAFGDGEYNRTMELAQQIAALRQQGVLARDTIAAFNATIQEYADDGINVRQAREARNDARQDLADGRFQEAIATIDTARSELEARRAERSLDRLFADTESVIERYDRAIGIGIIAVAVLGGLGYLIYRRRHRQYRLRKLRAKETALEELLKDNQRRYYQEESISKRLFEQRSTVYADELEETRSQIEALED